MSNKLRERQSSEHASPQAPAHHPATHDVPEHTRGSQQALARDVWRPPAISDAPASSGDETAQLDAIIQAIRGDEAATAAGLTTCLRRAWRVISAVQKANPAPDPRFGGTAGSTQSSGGSVLQPSATVALTGRVMVLVDVATDRMWELVRHEGDALDPARDLLVQIAAAVPGVALDKLPSLVEDGSREVAHHELHALEEAVLALQRDAVEYLILNFAWYAERASSNPRLARADLEENALAVFNAGVALGLEKVGEKVGKAITIGITLGKLATKLVGAAFSFVVGAFVDSVFEWVTHAEQHKIEDAQRQVAGDVAGYLTAKIMPLIDTIDASPACGHLRAELAAADTETAVTALTESFRGQRAALSAIKAPEGLAYGTDLLRTWVLENAGEEDGAGKKDHVSERDWQRALRDVTGNPDATEIHQCPDLFVHQTRAHFRRMGLEPTGDVAGIVSSLESSVVRTGTPEENAEATFSAVDDLERPITTRIVDIGAFQRSIAEEGKQVPLPALPMVMMYGLSGTLSIDLGTNHDSVYVDSWDYDVVVPGSQPADWIFLDAEVNPLTGELEVGGGILEEQRNRLAINLTPD